MRKQSSSISWMVSKFPLSFESRPRFDRYEDRQDADESSGGRRCRRMGTPVMIANGTIPDVLLRIAAGERFGTVFRATNTVLESRKRYLLTGFRSNEAAIILDSGATQAIKRGKSLLPAGIIGVQGEFDRGDTVRLVNNDGEEIAVGLVNYSASEIQKICGAKASEIETILGYTYADEVVHQDNMIKGKTR